MKIKKQRYWRIRIKRYRIKVLLDKVLIFRYIRRLHGRFWGVAGINFMIIGLSVCFFIRPDLLHVSTALSEFGNDVRTAPYFAASVFVGAYGLWRWRNYLGRTLKHPAPVYGLITLTILGLYLVALMPISWKPWPFRIHLFGVGLAGTSMVITVVLDGILSKTKRNKHLTQWRIIRAASVISIISGGWLTLGSLSVTGWYNVALLGETLMIGGYALWVSFKTYLGEGSSSSISKIINKFVSIY